MAKDVYQMVTDHIIEEMEKGIIPWRRPWVGTGEGLAISYTSRKPYSTLNQFLLGRPGEWLTWNQIHQLGGTVRKGAKSRFVVFYEIKRYKEKKNEDGEDVTEIMVREVPILKYYNVFHITDTEGIESKSPKPDENDKPKTEPIQAAEDIISGYLSRETELTFRNKDESNLAYYSPLEDLVVVPNISQFGTPEEYYSTAFHELTHTTGKAGRCDRKSEGEGAAFFGSENYSREELVAEIGSAMLCNRAGLDSEKTFRNSVAYLQSWLEALRNDKKMIVWAAGRAEKAAKYILNEND